MRLPALLVALLALLAVPSHAMSIEKVQAPAAPLQPEVDAGQIRVETVFSCEELFPDGGQVDFRFTAPAGVVITGPSSQRVPACPTPQGTQAQSSSFNVVLSRDLPGLELLLGVVRAEFIPASPDVPVWNHPRQAEVPFALTAAPWFASEATAERLASCACEALEFTIHLTNHGNVAARYTFELVDEARPGWSAQLPPALVVGSRMPGNATGDAVVSVHMDAPGEGALAVRIRQAAALAPDLQGEDLTVNLLARRTGGAASPDGAGAAAELPSVGMPIALGLLSLAGLLRRRA